MLKTEAASRKFDMSMVHISKSRSYAEGYEGEYLKIDWLGRPIYWQEDSEGWGTQCSGRLDERAYRLYQDFLEEKNIHKYRICHINAAKRLREEYGKFYKQLEQGSCFQAACWKIQVWVSCCCDLFSRLFRKGNDIEISFPDFVTISFEQETLIVECESTQAEKAGIFFVPPTLQNPNRITIVVDANSPVEFIIARLSNEKTDLFIKFKVDLWKEHAKSEDATIFDTYKRMYLPQSSSS